MFDSEMFDDNRNRTVTNSIHNVVYIPQSEDISVNYMKKKIKRFNLIKRKIFKKRDLVKAYRHKNMKSKPGLIDMLNMFCKNSSVSALNRIGKSSSTSRKIFWAFILCFGIIGCVSQVVQFLCSYYAYPVVINLESRKEKSPDFPALTLCNLNSIRREFEPCFENLYYGKCLNYSENYEGEKVLEHNSNPPCNDDPDNYTEQYMWQWMINLDDKRMMHYGHQVENFIKYCEFQGNRCYPENFTVSLSKIYGNCFTINLSEMELRPNYSSHYSALKLEIDIEVQKYDAYMDSLGARLQLHDPYVQHNMDKKGVNISPGFKTSIAISKSLFSRLSVPFNDRCEKYEIGDSQDTCSDLCHHNAFLNKCFCSRKKLPNVNSPLCDLRNPSVLCCINEFYDDSNNYEDDCDCPNPCDEVVYNMKISSTVWLHYADDYSNEHVTIKMNDSFYNESYHKVGESRIWLELYYDTFETIVYKQYPKYQSSELLSQIGGQMGLWLGLSLIVIFESLDNIIILWTRRKLHPKENDIS